MSCSRCCVDVRSLCKIRCYTLLLVSVGPLFATSTFLYLSVDGEDGEDHGRASSREKFVI